MDIKKVAVIGSGVMGSGIAAQITNAGVPVVLLDIKVEGKDLAAEAVQKMLKSDPAPFMRKRNAKMIETGTIEDDLDKIADCDWVIEVVLESLRSSTRLMRRSRKHVRKAPSFHRIHRPFRFINWWKGSPIVLQKIL